MKKESICLPTRRTLAGLSDNIALAARPLKRVIKKVPVPAKEGVYKVVSPLGEQSVSMLPAAPRLDTLKGKMICEISNTGYRSDETFPFIEKLLKKKYPTIKIVPYTEMPRCDVTDLSVDTRAKTIKALIAAIKEKGCDAVIGGNGA